MGKPKKGAKGHDEDFEDNEEVKTQPMEKKSTQEPSSNAPGKKDKKKKKGKARDDDEDWVIESELKALSLEANGAALEEEEEDEDAPVPIVNKKKDKKKTKGLSAFQLLESLDDPDVEDKSDKASDDEKDDIVLETVVPEVNKSKKKDKGKKKEKKPLSAADEDIEAIMASLDKKPEKKKGKKSKKADDEDKQPETEVPLEHREVPKVEPKVVTIDDYDDEEFDRKKKKKGKKGKAEEAEQERVEEPRVVTIDDYEDEEDEGKKKKKGKKVKGGEVEKKKDGEDLEDDSDEEEEGEAGTVKTAAQKKKEKKEREKQKKLLEKQKQKKGKKEDVDATGQTITAAKHEEPALPSAGVPPEKSESKESSPDNEGDKEEDAKDGKKKKKKKGEKEEKEKVKPNKKIAQLKEHLKKLQEEEQKAKEEAERLRLLEEERIQKLEEEKRLEEERRLKKKMKKKEREERLKKEGKFLTEKQKQDKRRLEQMLESIKVAGAEIPGKEEAHDAPKKRPIYQKKKKTQAQAGGDHAEKSPSPTTPTSAMEIEAVLPEPDAAARRESEGEVCPDPLLEDTEIKDVKEEWDAESDKEENDQELRPSLVRPFHLEKKTHVHVSKAMEEKEEEEDDDEDEEEEDEVDDEGDQSESESEEESSEDSDDEEMTPAERGREKVTKRAEKALKERSTDNLRAPVVCVLGHVDTGKTKILDKLRRTNVQDNEAGGITQQIGATNVPKDAIIEKTKMCKEFAKQELRLPGLLIIDTPGHESFSNLRIRGTSLCDIAILVIDIMHGLEPQTIESINILKERKTPFVVALNKVDRLYQWKPQPTADVQNTIKKQTPHTKAEFDERAQHVIVQLAQEGLNAALFYDNKNPKEYISLVPTSAHSGDGMGNLVALIAELCQTLLAKRLMYCSNLQAVTMEVKAITGMGTTIDVILINGTINEGDTIVLAGTEGPIVTQIRGLLMPQPMKELRVKSQYEHFKTVKAAQGVKIIAKDMEKALAGLPLYVAHDEDEKAYYKEEVAAVLKDTLEAIKVQERGVFVQASTLGSLEALLEFLKTSEIPYAGISIGPVHKKDIMKASVMLEHDSQYAVILAFDVKVEREAQEMADTLGVKIFTADIIYHLFDAFTKYREDLKRKKQEEFRHIAVFPCRLRILPQFIFNTRDPIVMGVSVEAGFLKEGTPICVPNKEFLDIGRITSMEVNNKPVEVGKQGQEICIKISPIPGDAPKMFGRHFEETDMLVSKITRQSIDAVKDHFRDEMSKQDWRLMVELKKQFEIL